MNRIAVTRNTAVAPANVGGSREIGLVREWQTALHMAAKDGSGGLLDAQSLQTLRRLPDQFIATQNSQIEFKDLSLFVRQQSAGADFDAQRVARMQGLVLHDAIR